MPWPECVTSCQYGHYVVHGRNAQLRPLWQWFGRNSRACLLPLSTSPRALEYVGVVTARIDPKKPVQLVSFVVDNFNPTLADVKRKMFLVLLAVAQMVIWRDCWTIQSFLITIRFVILHPSAYSWPPQYAVLFGPQPWTSKFSLLYLANSAHVP